MQGVDSGRRAVVAPRPRADSIAASTSACMGAGPGILLSRVDGVEERNQPGGKGNRHPDRPIRPGRSAESSAWRARGGSCWPTGLFEVAQAASYTRESRPDRDGNGWIVQVACSPGDLRVAVEITAEHDHEVSGTRRYRSGFAAVVFGAVDAQAHEAKHVAAFALVRKIAPQNEWPARSQTVAAAIPPEP